MLNYLRSLRQRLYVARLVRDGLRLGNNVYLNDGFFLDSAHCFLIAIDDDVVFGPKVSVFAHDASSLKVIGATRIGLVHLKRNCFIGANCVILPGAIVGENSILAANSTLSSEVPDDELWGGSPARRIMSIDDFRNRLSEISGPTFAESEYRMCNITAARKAEMIIKLAVSRIGFLKQ